MFDAQYLKDRLEKPLPGESAQIKMAHAFRRKLWPAPQDAYYAGVLIHFYPKNQDWHLVLIQRTSGNGHDRHAGQISFPGGRKDVSDADIVACALREGREEVGLQLDPSHYLGQLTPLYIPVSNYLVHPVISWSLFTPSFVAQPSEVHEVLEVPFRHFFGGRNVKHTDILLQQNATIKDVPYFDVEGRVVWGATAMIISELVSLFPGE
jgi:8-oxo-dGTP pyrophosphatase MutT (NUDIX family)